MLELDVLLIPFTEEALPSLPPDVQQQYLELLDSEDQTLFQWLTGKGSPSSARLREMVEKVLAHNASKGPSGSG
jgi:antitoxin CptB